MRALHYGSGTLIVSDDVCNALTQYAVALAERGLADVVSVPTLVGGQRSDAELVLGPASQLYCTPADEADVDLHDVSVVDDIIARTKTMLPARAVVTDPSDIADLGFDDDYQ